VASSLSISVCFNGERCVDEEDAWLSMVLWWGEVAPRHEKGQARNREKISFREING
jgi:hypothetical protein